MSFPEVVSLVTGLLQFIVAGYALRLNRIFGTARAGWSLFWAFSFLALLHVLQSVASFNHGAPLGIEIEAIYSLISLFLLISLVHIETLLRERLRVEQDEERLRGGLELLVQDKTAHLTRAIEELQLEIAGRKRAQEALTTEQRRLNSLIMAVPEQIYFKDQECRFIRINEAFARRQGLSDIRMAEGKTDFDLFGEHHARQAYEDEQRIMATGEAMIDQEEKEDWKDGHVTWVSSTKLPLRDGTGKIVGIMGISRDITGRKRAEQELTELLDFNQKIISDAPVGVIVYKTSGQCVLANEAAARTLAAEGPNLLKQDFRQIESWRDSGLLQMAEEVMADKSPRHADIHFTSTFGKEVWMICRITHFVRGDEPHLLLLFNDITERKRAEEAIREQTRLLDLAQDAIVVRDLEDRIQYWNQGAEQLFGWTVAEALEQPAWRLLHEEIFKHRDAIKLALEKGRWSGELNCRTKGGRELIVETRLTLVRDSQGKPKSILSISTDITDKKKFEAQMYRSQRMESLGTLAGGIAHDLNNVLSPLLVSVQVLKAKVADEDGRRLLEALETNVQRGASLVKQVLAFGRGVTGERIVLQPKHIAREIKQIVNGTFPKSVEFEFHSTADSWAIVGDPTQLHQVLLNLCVNARDAMPDGGKLSIHLENVIFDEVYAGMNLEAKPGPYVYIRVTDTGTGIPKEIQEKIYDPFFTTKEVGKGTGLGLSTTLAIVKSHGGFINCYSEPGKGTTFKVYFPANLTGVAAEDPATEADLPRGHNELVLVVDDEKPICLVAKKMLERFGYRVLLAADGTEAVSLYATRRNEIDVVITDIAMPNMDGFATIGALKAINQAVKIVGSSGYASGVSVTRISNSGVRYFVPKPYTAETMLGALQEILHEESIN